MLNLNSGSAGCCSACLLHAMHTIRSTAQKIILFIIGALFG